jgi:hypothetical protein
MTSRPYFRLSSQSGLGLVSLMLVILALSLAAITVMAVVAPSLATRQRLDTETKGKALRLGLNRYQAHFGIYPPSFNELVTGPVGACVASATPPALSGWCGPYVDPSFLVSPGVYSDEYQKDGWGSAFNYSGPPTGALRSCGPDRICANGDDIEFL